MNSEETIQWIQWEEQEQEDEEQEGYAVDEGHRESAGVSAEVAAVVEEHGAEIEGWPTCCICLEPMTSDGAHRTCCLPCGHVYGRSCLEKWFHRCGNTSAKCPQCCLPFGHKQITNLHVSVNVSDDFCCIQELAEKIEQQHSVIQLNEENQQLKEELALDKQLLALNEENTKQLKENLALAKQLLAVNEENAKLREEVIQELTKKIEQLREQMAEERRRKAPAPAPAPATGLGGSATHVMSTTSANAGAERKRVVRATSITGPRAGARLGRASSAPWR